MVPTSTPTIQASIKNIRISPRKVRLVADVMRGLSVTEAEQRLWFLPKKSAEPLKKLLLSAVANAEHNHKLKKTDLKIQKITVNEGPKLKRWQPRAMGRATPLLKRTSRIILVITGRAVTKPAIQKKVVSKKS